MDVLYPGASFDGHFLSLQEGQLLACLLSHPKLVVIGKGVWLEEASVSEPRVNYTFYQAVLPDTIKHR